MGPSVSSVVTECTRLFQAPRETGQKITPGPLKSSCMTSWSCHVNVHLIFLHFLCCMCSATTSWLFATREIKHSTEKPEGQDQDATAENILFATLPKSTAMFALEGRGLSLLWRLSECWYALRSGLRHTSAFLHAIPTPYLSPAPQNCPFPETRLQWAVAALPSQPREVLNEWYLLKQSVDAQPQGPSSLSRDKPLWFRSRWCCGRFILHRAFKSMLVQCKQSYLLWSYLQAKPSRLCESTKPHWFWEDPFGQLSMGDNLSLHCPKAIPGHSKLYRVRVCILPTILCFLPALDIPQGENPPTSPWVCALPSTS